MNQYTEELYNTLMDPEFEHRCMTTVIICGPPPPKPDSSRPDGVLGIAALNTRDAWLDEVTALAKDRFGISYGNIGDFITVLEVWWQSVREGETCFMDQ